MKDIKNFTISDAKKMRDEMQIALEIVAKKYNADANIGNIKFGDNLEAKITFSKRAEGMFGEYTQTKESLAFQAMGWKHQIPVEALNQTFDHNGENITITGYNRSAPKYPINYTKDNRAFKCSPSYMLSIVKMSLPSVML